MFWLNHISLKLCKMDISKLFQSVKVKYRIVQLSNGLHTIITAEGVETNEDREDIENQ
jgi:EAL domain-containing protein (putative c-di-GMP-specific phosphodiesterase class I)